MRGLRGYVSGRFRNQTQTELPARMQIIDGDDYEETVRVDAPTLNENRAILAQALVRPLLRSLDRPDLLGPP